MKTEKQSFRQIARDCKVRVTFKRKIQGQLDNRKIEGPDALVRDVAAGPAAKSSNFFRMWDYKKSMQMLLNVAGNHHRLKFTDEKPF